MRKIFRFKYEPCNNMCYAWCDKLPSLLRTMGEKERVTLVDRMVKAHDNLCDNPDYSFGVDTDENMTNFVAHFRTPEFTHIYHSRSFEECVNKVCDDVLKAEIPQIALDCPYGENGNEDLGNEILKFCLDENYKLLEERHCECKAHTA